MSHRRLVLAFALTITMSLLAFIAVTIPVRSLPDLISSSVPALPPTPVPVYSGPSVELSRRAEYADIANAVAAYDAFQRAADEEAARQAAADAAAKRRTAKTSRVTAGAPVVVDGDRFDRLSTCESHQNPTDLSPGGKYRGAFQFSLATWHAAGMPGDPIDFSYGEQKATAMSWAQVADPFGQWPVCWPRSA